MRIYRGAAGADGRGQGACAPSPGAWQSSLVQLSLLSQVHSAVVEVCQAGESGTTQPSVSQLRLSAPFLLRQLAHADRHRTGQEMLSVSFFCAFPWPQHQVKKKFLL